MRTHIWFFILFTIIFIITITVFNIKNETFHNINDNTKQLTKINIKTGIITPFRNSDAQRRCKTPLVVLYSTQYRTWDITCDNHIEYLKHITGGDLSNTLVGIHYWTDDRDVPPAIQQLKYKSSMSDNNVSEEMPADYEKYGKATKYSIIWFRRFIHSTKIALQNAEQLYQDTYGVEMPLNQMIIRLRPDVHIYNIENIQLPLLDEDNYYISTWNTDHRDYNSEYPEITDVVTYTTKKSLIAILNTDIDNFMEDLYQQLILYESCDIFVEQLIVILLQKLNIPMIYDFNLKLSLLRSNGEMTILSNEKYIDLE